MEGILALGVMDFTTRFYSIPRPALNTENFVRLSIAIQKNDLQRSMAQLEILPASKII